MDLPLKANVEDKKSIVTYCLHNNEKHNWYVNSLSESFHNNIKSYTSKEFKLAESDVRQHLRELLWRRKIYVPKSQNLQFAEEIFQVTQENISWPKDNLKNHHHGSLYLPKDNGNEERNRRKHFKRKRWKNIANKKKAVVRKIIRWNLCFLQEMV